MRCRTDKHHRIPAIDTELYSSYAGLLDSLSLALAYPTEALIEAWRTGVFMEHVESTLAALPVEEAARHASTALTAGIQNYFHPDRQAQEIQADYVGLFEHNRDHPPVHLLQHLYSGDAVMSQIELYKTLLGRYRRCGIALKQGEAALPPDQLSVQLEFIAYLYAALAAGVAAEQQESYRKELADGVRMLRWIDQPLQRLAQEHYCHPIYLPLLQLTRAVLNHCDVTLKDID